MCSGYIWQGILFMFILQLVFLSCLHVQNHNKWNKRTEKCHDAYEIPDLLKPHAGVLEIHYQKTPTSPLLRAIAMYQGPFLNGIFSEWAQVLRIDLETKYQTALMNLANYRACKRNFPGAVRLLETVLTTDPYNEEAPYQLQVTLLEAGETVAALQQLRKYAKLCREEMGADLPPRFSQCRRRITTLLASTV